MLQKPLIEMTLEEISVLLDVEEDRAIVYTFLSNSALMGMPVIKVKDGTITLEGDKIILKAKADTFDATQVTVYPSPLLNKSLPMSYVMTDGETRLAIALLAIAEKDNKPVPAIRVERTIKGTKRNFLIQASVRPNNHCDVFVSDKLREAVRDVLDGTRPSALQGFINNESAYTFRAFNLKEEKIEK